MLRSVPVCLLAALSLLACEGLVRVPGEQTTGSQTGDEPTTGAPTTGAPDATSTAAEPTSTTPDDGEDSTTAWDCPFYQLEVRVTVPQVMLVLDKSGSMSTDAGRWDHDGDDADDDGLVDAAPDQPATEKITRWRSLYLTIESLVGAFEPRVDFGAVLFPALTASNKYDITACPVDDTPDVPVGPDQGATILATIPPPNSTQLSGGTPTSAGIGTGLTGLADVRDPEGATPQYLVLVTDGAANCLLEPIDASEEALFEFYDEQLIGAVADALAAGIPTFVVGIAIDDSVSESIVDGQPDATNPFVRLNEVAEAGGEPLPGPAKFHDARNQLELEAALQQIYQEVTSCTLSFSQPLADFESIREVEVDGTQPLVYGHHEVVDCASESGWRFTDETRTGIELCGDACAQYKVYGELEIEFDCIYR